MAHQTIEITVFDDGELKVSADMGRDIYEKHIEVTDKDDPDGSKRVRALQALLGSYFELRRASLAKAAATV